MLAFPHSGQIPHEQYSPLNLTGDGPPRSNLSAQARLDLEEDKKSHVFHHRDDAVITPGNKYEVMSQVTQEESKFPALLK